MHARRSVAWLSSGGLRVVGPAPDVSSCTCVCSLAAADHETFESVDAGASLTYPQQAGTIRKNGFIVIKQRPCKVGRQLGQQRGRATAAAARRPVIKQLVAAGAPAACMVARCAFQKLLAARDGS
jgi:hypothetical protein